MFQILNFRKMLIFPIDSIPNVILPIPTDRESPKQELWKYFV